MEPRPIGVDAYFAHFTDPVYGDDILDCAPFGSDQGADMLHAIEESGGQLPDDATISSVLPWGTVEDHFDAAEAGDWDGMQEIYAAGFLLLRFRGSITDADYSILRRAIENLTDKLMATGRAPGVEQAEKLRSVVIPDLDAFMAATPGR